MFTLPVHRGTSTDEVVRHSRQPFGLWRLGYSAAGSAQGLEYVRHGKLVYFDFKRCAIK